MYMLHIQGQSRDGNFRAGFSQTQQDFYRAIKKWDFGWLSGYKNTLEPGSKVMVSNQTSL